MVGLHDLRRSFPAYDSIILQLTNHLPLSENWQKKDYTMYLIDLCTGSRE